MADAVGANTPDYPADDVDGLREQLLQPDQSVVNFNYLARIARG